MKLNIAAAATLCTVFVSPVLAEEVVMYRPIQAGSLHEGPLDMVAYWWPAPTEVVHPPG